MSRRVVVVGAGIVGLCCAHYLRRDGNEVVVVDREAGPGTGTSYGNAGMIVPSHFVPLAAPGVIEQGIRWMRDPASPFYVKPRLSPRLLRWGYAFWRASSQRRVDSAAPLLLALNQASQTEYLALERDVGDFGLRRAGLLMLCASDHGLDEEAVVATRARALGLDARVLSPDDLAELEPGVGFGVVGAVHYVGDSSLDPGLVMERLHASLAADGVEFTWGTHVTSIETAGAKVTGVRAATGAVGGDAVVVAAGSWSAALARTAGTEMLLEPGTGFSLTVPAPRHTLTTPAILSEARVAVSPLGERLRVGGTMALAGFDGVDDERRVAGIIASATRYLPGLDERELRSAPRWRGLRPCTPDGLPYLGRSATYPDLTFATGHAMLGVSLAPVTGRLVADLVAGRSTSLDIAALDPQRHARRRGSPARARRQGAAA